MQGRYGCLRGSHPLLRASQGRGQRRRQLYYGIDEEAGELVLFGYSSPAHFLEGRGLVRKGQALRSYILTDHGRVAFDKLLGSGGVSSNEFRQVVLAKRVIPCPLLRATRPITFAPQRNGPVKTERSIPLLSDVLPADDKTNRRVFAGEGL